MSYSVQQKPYLGSGADQVVIEVALRYLRTWKNRQIVAIKCSLADIVSYIYVSY